MKTSSFAAILFLGAFAFMGLARGHETRVEHPHPEVQFLDDSKSLPLREYTS